MLPLGLRLFRPNLLLQFSFPAAQSEPLQLTLRRLVETGKELARGKPAMNKFSGSPARRL
jgi:hypothetical protein